MRRLIKALWHLAAVVGLITVLVGALFWTQGISSRTPPSAIETSAARMARRAMIPAAVRDTRNPETASPENLRAGLEHWADHCATCHSNDGSGMTEMGQGMYPRVPDMRLSATQELTDGELFYIIENGVKLTGMPAWGTGTPEGERGSWHLVQFIRRLPALTDEEIAEMERLNPRSPAEWQALEEERRFLAGEAPPPAPAEPKHQHKGPGH